MTPRTSPLRAVGDDEKPEPPAAKKPKTVAQAAKSNDPRELLVAMRDRIAEGISRNDCQLRDLAALTKRLQDIAHDIDALDARDDGEAVARVRVLESALREVDPGNPLLSGSDVTDDAYDPSTI